MKVNEPDKPEGAEWHLGGHGGIPISPTPNFWGSCIGWSPSFEWPHHLFHYAYLLYTILR